ncbi:hypothetical protein EVAR_17314_1 [Eumeta japonica]|uniref:Uncharacterized protein n=1 Tax=Eumeta variegata TaxID=151549 RepID=A0A4C1TT64_EUMVA|nr:hypothetical protein EVAR_17314_1 [Eumeta japonica]
MLCFELLLAKKHHARRLFITDLQNSRALVNLSNKFRDGRPSTVVNINAVHRMNEIDGHWRPLRYGPESVIENSIAVLIPYSTWPPLTASVPGRRKGNRPVTVSCDILCRDDRLQESSLVHVTHRRHSDVLSDHARGFKPHSTHAYRREGVRDRHFLPPPRRKREKKAVSTQENSVTRKPYKMEVPFNRITMTVTNSRHARPLFGS